MSGDYSGRIYFGTVLLERNRWVKGERLPSLAVSDWVRRIGDEGFDGLELWENHAALAGEEERLRLRESPVPVRILNCYDRCGSETAGARRRAVELAGFLSAGGMKFNFGREPERHEEYVTNVRAWRALLPADFRFLCECHGGTNVEAPERAAETFARLGRENYEIIVHGFGGDEAGLRRRFELHGGRITHVHVSLPADGPGAEPGTRKRVELLGELGFRGSYTIEFTEGVGADGETPERLFRNAVRDMKLVRKCLDG